VKRVTTGIVEQAGHALSAGATVIGDAASNAATATKDFITEKF